MRNRRLLGLLTVALLLWGCQRTTPRAEPQPFRATAERERESTQTGVFYTVHLLQLAHEEHGLAEELWQHIDEDAPQGASRELRRYNNLRIGLVKDRFRAATGAIVERMYTRQLSSIPTFCPADKVQFFPCGRSRESVTLFLWTADDEVLGRSFPQLSLAMEVAAVPVHEKLAKLTVTPALVLEPRDRQSVRPLRTIARCPVGSSLVIGAVDPQGQLLGKFFQTTANSPDDREQLLIITVDAVRPEASP